MAAATNCGARQTPPPGTEDICAGILAKAAALDDSPYKVPTEPITNPERRKWCFISYFRPAMIAGWLTNRPFVVDHNKKRFKYSGCILRRVRTTAPSAEYLGFKDFPDDDDN